MYVNEFDAITGQELQRPFTPEELKEYKRIQKAADAVISKTKPEIIAE
jgi:hypothetical protein